QAPRSGVATTSPSGVTRLRSGIPSSLTLALIGPPGPSGSEDRDGTRRLCTAQLSVCITFNEHVETPYVNRTGSVAWRCRSKPHLGASDTHPLPDLTRVGVLRLRRQGIRFRSRSPLLPQEDRQLH